MSAFAAPTTYQLERDLAAAEEDDRRHAVVDAVKKRAITTARSYAEFRDRVACATLRPLTRDDLGRRVAVSSNRFAAAASQTPHDTGAAAAVAAASVRTSVASPSVRTEADFYRAWRRAVRDDEARMRLLEAATTGAGLSALLRTAVDPALVSDAIAVMESAAAGGAWDSRAAAVALRALHQLRAVRGADTARAMLSRDEAQRLEAVTALAECTARGDGAQCAGGGCGPEAPDASGGVGAT